MLPSTGRLLRDRQPAVEPSALVRCVTIEPQFLVQ